MHDILEGALQYEVKLMLKALIMEDEQFSLGMSVKKLYCHFKIVFLYLCFVSV